MNVEVTAGLLELPRLHAAGRFLLASTNAVTSAHGRSARPSRPLTPYGSTKAAAEMLLSGHSASYGLTGAALPARPGEMPAVVLDITTARTLGYSPGTCRRPASRRPGRSSPRRRSDEKGHMHLVHQRRAGR